MKIVRTPYKTLDLKGTLSTVEVGETWKIDRKTYTPGYIRVTCSNFFKESEKLFRVNAPSYSKWILVTRVK